MKAAGSLRAGFLALHGGTRRRAAGGAKRPQGHARRSRARAAGPSVTASRSRSSTLSSRSRWRGPTHHEVGSLGGHGCRLEDGAVVFLQDLKP